MEMIDSDGTACRGFGIDREKVSHLLLHKKHTRVAMTTKVRPKVWMWLAEIEIEIADTRDTISCLVIIPAGWWVGSNPSSLESL